MLSNLVHSLPFRRNLIHIGTDSKIQQIVTSRKEIAEYIQLGPALILQSAGHRTVEKLFLMTIKDTKTREKSFDYITCWRVNSSCLFTATDCLFFFVIYFSRSSHVQSLKVQFLLNNSEK